MEIFKNEKFKDRRRKHMNTQLESCVTCIDNVMKLSGTELSMLFTLACYANNENIILKNNGKYATCRSDVAMILNVSEGNKNLASMLRHKVISKIKYGNIKAYAINPYIIYKGKTVHPDVYMGFSKSEYRYVYGDDYYEEVLV